MIERNGPNLIISNLLEVGRITPFAGNMFDVAIFGRDQDTRNDTLEFPRAHLHCSSITLGTPELRFKDRHPLTKQQLLDGIQFQDTVTITWLEDQFLSVWNYHRTWMSYFYDRERDQFRSGAYGKKRIAEVFVQEMRSIDSPYYANSRENAENNSVQHFISLEGLMPVKLPEVPLNWTQDSSQFAELQVTYRLDNLKYQIADPRRIDSDEESRTRQAYSGTQNPTVGVEL